MTLISRYWETKYPRGPKQVAFARKQPDILQGFGNDELGQTDV